MEFCLVTEKSDLKRACLLESADSSTLEGRGCYQRRVRIGPSKIWALEHGLLPGSRGSTINQDGSILTEKCGQTTVLLFLGQETHQPVM